MADYHAILKRAIGALPEPTGEARRSVYEKARTALVNQLKSFDPPLSASEITQQRLQLEDAIRKVEAEAAKSILNQALNRTPTSATRPPPPAPPAATTSTATPPTGGQVQTPTAPTSPPGAASGNTAPPSAAAGSAVSAAAAGSAARTARAANAAASPPADRPAEPTRPTAPPRPSVAPPAARDRDTAKPAPEPAPPAAAKGRVEPAVAAPTATATTSEKAPPGAEVRPARPGFDRMRARGKAEPATGPETGTAPEVKSAPADAAATPLRGVIDEADKLGAATAETARQARDALSAAGGMVDGEGRGGKGKARSERRAARRGRQEDTGPEGGKPSRLPLFVGLAAAALVVAVAGGAVWTMRDEIAGYFGADRPIAGFTGRNEKSLPPKSTDRLLADGGQAGRPAAAADGVKVVTTEPIAPAAPPKPPLPPAPSAAAPATPSPAATPPAASPPATPAPAAPSPSRPADPAATATATPPAAASDVVAAAPTPAPPPPLPTATVPPVAQKVSLLEEGAPGGGQSTVSEGKVIWQTVREPPQPGRQPVTIVKARVEVPGRGLVLNLAFQPNTDTSFPASHLIELRFEVPGDFDHKGISNVPGLILKTTEQARGDPLVGAAARISNNFFWIALSSPEADKVRNIGLLKERGWIDVPMLYEDGRRAILTLEKAGAGDRVVAEAVEAWGQGG